MANDSSIERESSLPPHLICIRGVAFLVKCAKVRIVSNILTYFGKSSRRMVNIGKSKVLSSKGVVIVNRMMLSNICVVAIVRDLGRYLGFPLKSSRVTYERF